ncbi:hypothetical protein LLH23_20665 [bacterium]|nr:hypothetical protein [bacterium]
MTAVGTRLCRAAVVAATACLSLLPAWAQLDPPGPVVTQAERSRAAMMILVLVLVGMLLTIGLLWVLRRKGILKEEKPDGPLRQLEDEIARRSDEMKK